MSKERQEIIEWLEKQINKNLTYECMPENEEGYYYIPRHKLSNIVDGLIPLVKGKFKNNDGKKN